jgi:tetratricopeptide (TPR) repeat protein
MKRLLSLALAACIGLAAATPAMAADDATTSAAMLQQVAQLQHEWAVANYQTPEKNKEAAFKSLVDKASALTARYPNRAEPKIWEAIIRAGYAGAMGGLQSLFSAMPQMKQGRDLLLAAEKIDPKAMNGSVYTTLGSFYYMVPGGFIGFGDDDKALAYLKKALEIAPDDIDANYFMGDYWLHEKKYAKAVPYFEKVLALPDVVSRPIYSKGRKAEAAAKLSQAKKHIH